MSKLLPIGAALLMAGALYLGLVAAPREAVLGDSQRVFYAHLPCAWNGFLGLTLVAVSSALYLATGRVRFDRLAQASGEVGVLFTSLVLVTGPLWAKNDWGMYWTWDARLTSTFVLWLLFVGYLMIRSNALDPVRIRSVLAVYALVAYLDVPFVYYSIRWFRTQHPAPVIGSGGGGLAPDMRVALYAGAVAYLALFAELLRRRLAILQAEERLDVLEGSLS